jgi:hypothetical protein
MQFSVGQPLDAKPSPFLRRHSFVPTKLSTAHEVPPKQKGGLRATSESFILQACRHYPERLDARSVSSRVPTLTVECCKHVDKIPVSLNPLLPLTSIPAKHSSDCRDYKTLANRYVCRLSLHLSASGRALNHLHKCGSTSSLFCMKSPVTE